MKRNVLLSAVTLMMTANVFAQAEDVTPAAFKFQERSVGPVEMFWGTGANPSIAELNVSGSIVTAVAPANQTEEEALSSGLSIVNSEFGNLLLLKGKNAPASAEGPASTGDLGKGWFSLNFIGPASAEGGNDYRVTYQMKMVSDLEIGVKKLGLSCVSGGGNNTSLGSKSEVLFTGDSGWWQFQINAKTGTKDPFRARIEFDGQMMDKTALYVYEVSFVRNPEGELVNTEGTENADGSYTGMSKPNGAVSVGVASTMSDLNAPFVTWDHQYIYVNNANNREMVYIYNMIGQLVHSAEATAGFMEIPMNPGAYIVKVGAKSTKVIL
ncbi:T9SS type A sorting domain-containing protein [Bacteroides salyersiae]|jgi:hypothetical protein|uniref:T9SS type A sorting domain-containing protein n=1 Tax=Bacteroides salyersiae TaxID=291644 RepID=UPI00397D3F6F